VRGFTLTALVAKPKPERTDADAALGLKLASGSEHKSCAGESDTSAVTWKIRAVRDGEYNLSDEVDNGQRKARM